jgi:hypothetical protein
MDLGKDGPDGYRYYWKVDDADPAIFSRDSNARSSVMVWGIFPLVAVPKKCDSVKYCGILEEGLTPYYNTVECLEVNSNRSQTCVADLRLGEVEGCKT